MDVKSQYITRYFKIMLKGIVLLEVVLSIALFSIIALVTSKTILTISKKDYINRTILNANLVLETTRLFIVSNGTENLKYIDNKLYYDDNLLLKNISKFTLNSTNNISTIDICISKQICQSWKIKL